MSLDARLSPNATSTNTSSSTQQQQQQYHHSPKHPATTATTMTIVHGLYQQALLLLTRDSINKNNNSDDDEICGHVHNGLFLMTLDASAIHAIAFWCLLWIGVRAYIIPIHTSMHASFCCIIDIIVICTDSIECFLMDFRSLNFSVEISMSHVCTGGGSLVPFCVSTVCSLDGCIGCAVGRRFARFDSFGTCCFKY